MNWSRVKWILIVLLLAVDILLLYQLFGRLRERNEEERAALGAAVAILQDAGLAADPLLFDAMPVTLPAYSFERDAQFERALALAILPDAVEEALGGGVVRFSSPAGSIHFRNGGLFDMEINAKSAGIENIEDMLAKTLHKVAGAFTQYAGETAAQSAFYRLKTDEGYTVAGATASLEWRGETVYMQGCWAFSSQKTVQSVSAARAEMVIRLLEAAQAAGASSVTALSVQYGIDSPHTDLVRMVPYWLAETDGGALLIPCS